LQKRHDRELIDAAPLSTAATLKWHLVHSDEDELAAGAGADGPGLPDARDAAVEYVAQMPTNRVLAVLKLFRRRWH
jgi:hypothetical protein